MVLKVVYSIEKTLYVITRKHWQPFTVKRQTDIIHLFFFLLCVSLLNKIIILSRLYIVWQFITLNPIKSILYSLLLLCQVLSCFTGVVLSELHFLNIDHQSKVLEHVLVQ